MSREEELGHVTFHVGQEEETLNRYPHSLKRKTDTGLPAQPGEVLEGLTVLSLPRRAHRPPEPLRGRASSSGPFTRSADQMLGKTFWEVDPYKQLKCTCVSYTRDCVSEHVTSKHVMPRRPAVGAHSSHLCMQLIA